MPSWVAPTTSMHKNCGMVGKLRGCPCCIAGPTAEPNNQEWGESKLNMATTYLSMCVGWSGNVSHGGRLQYQLELVRARVSVGWAELGVFISSATWELGLSYNTHQVEPKWVWSGFQGHSTHW